MLWAPPTGSIRFPVLIEELSPYEISVVLGMKMVDGAPKWLWPPDDLFKNLTCSTGEWNEECERWFQAKLTVLQSAVSVHTYHWWERDSRFGRRDRVDHVKASMPALTLSRTASGAFVGWPSCQGHYLIRGVKRDSIADFDHSCECLFT
jgi:hypothetical protein